MSLLNKFRRRMFNPFYKKRVKNIAFGIFALIITVLIYIAVFSLMTS